MITEPWNHRITKHTELEGTHKHHQVQILAPVRKYRCMHLNLNLNLNGVHGNRKGVTNLVEILVYIPYST